MHNLRGCTFHIIKSLIIGENHGIGINQEIVRLNNQFKIVIDLCMSFPLQKWVLL